MHELKNNLRYPKTCMRNLLKQVSCMKSYAAV